MQPDLRIVFERDEPFVQFYEVERETNDSEDLQQLSVIDDPEILSRYASYLKARQDDARAYELDPSPRRPLGHYDRGEYPDGTAAVDASRCPVKRGNS